VSLRRWTTLRFVGVPEQTNLAELDSAIAVDTA